MQNNRSTKPLIALSAVHFLLGGVLLFFASPPANAMPPGCIACLGNTCNNVGSLTVPKYKCGAVEITGVCYDIYRTHFWCNDGAPEDPTIYFKIEHELFDGYCNPGTYCTT